MKQLTGRTTPAEQRTGTAHAGENEVGARELRKLKEAPVYES